MKTKEEIVLEKYPLYKGINKNALMKIHIPMTDAFYFMEEYAKQNKWISVDERFPKREGNKTYSADYLTADENGNLVVRVYDYQYGRWSQDLYGIITHWQPLPEPPKKGGKE